MTTLPRLLSVLLGGLALGACTGGGDPVSDGADAGAVEIAIENFAYEPERVEVAPGTTITWTNRDDFAHTVTSGDPGAPSQAFDLELGDPSSHGSSGKMASVVLDEPGEVSYFCRLHPRMTATVIVTEER